jgi:hypothetical protein
MTMSGIGLAVLLMDKRRKICRTALHKNTNEALMLIMASIRSASDERCSKLG